MEEVEGPTVSPSQGETEEEGLDLSDRCWKDGIDDIWMTDFPPPEGFTGYENRPYDEYNDPEPYVRACTEDEVAILEADRAALWAGERAEEEELRDQWFTMLKEAARTRATPDMPAVVNAQIGVVIAQTGDSL